MFTGRRSLDVLGVVIRLPDGDLTIYVKLGRVIADFDALKQALDSKGANGIAPCIWCRNVVAKASDVASRRPHLVEITCCDSNKFEASSSEDVIGKYACVADVHARRAAGSATKAQCEAVEKATGYNHNPHGVIASLSLRSVFPPIDVLMADPTHCLFSQGTFALEVALFLQNSKLTWKEWHTMGSASWEIQGTFRFMRCRLKRIFDEALLQKNEGGKLMASELLLVYPLLRHIAERVYEPGDARNGVYRSFQKACVVIDLVQKVRQGQHVDHELFTRAVSEHLRTFIEVHGVEYVRPKHHFTFHLSMQLLTEKTLYDCWCCEHKHSSAKRVVTNIKKLGGYEKAALTALQWNQDRLLEQLVCGDGLRGPTAHYRGFRVADVADIRGSHFHVGDVVRRDSMCGQVVAGAEAAGVTGILVTQGVLKRRCTLHSEVWDFYGGGVAFWSDGVYGCAAWYPCEDDIVVLVT